MFIEARAELAARAVEEWDQGMQAAEPGTDVRERETARARPENDAETATGRPGNPGRFPRPRRSAPSLALAPESSEPGPARLDRQRARRLVTAAEAVRKFPFEGLGRDRWGSSQSNGRAAAALAREAIADHLQGSEACQLEAFEQALALAAERANVAFQAQEGWVDGVRAGLLALLEFFDEEPELAAYLVVHSAQAGAAVLERRREVLERLALVLDEEHGPRRAYPPPLTAQAVASGVLGVLHGRLSQPDPGALVELAGPLMSFIVLPFIDVRAARRELSRPLDASGAAKRVALDVLQGRGGHLSYRTVSVLRVIAAEPGLSGKEVGLRAGIKDQGQTSRLLSRLTRLGLVEDSLQPGGAKAWRLTSKGEELEAAVRHETPTPERRVAFELAQVSGGRLDYRTVSVLRVIGDQPGLSNRALALRTGYKDGAAISNALSRLAGFGLIESTRGEGRQNAWQLTADGEELDGRVGREIPAWRRSTALELMRESGGRLSDRVISVLRTIGAEPGLSNKALAARVGIRAEIHISQLLARLAERGLIENVRTQGRENVWQLTAAGKRLDRAIERETPPPARGLALDLMRDTGGRLSHRAVSALRVVAANPGMSNTEIARRVGIESTGHASTLLARLARRGLIKSTRTTGRRNVWQLTARGRELERAFRDEVGNR
jgi:DNA-binding MarR family transcriptional regulator